MTPVEWIAIQLIQMKLFTFSSTFDLGSDGTVFSGYFKSVVSFSFHQSRTKKTNQIQDSEFFTGIHDPISNS